MLSPLSSYFTLLRGKGRSEGGSSEKKWVKYTWTVAKNPSNIAINTPAQPNIKITRVNSNLTSTEEVNPGSQRLAAQDRQVLGPRRSGVDCLARAPRHPWFRRNTRSYPTWFAKAFGLRQRHGTKPLMILPQVHLRKPCYDFYFL